MHTAPPTKVSYIASTGPVTKALRTSTHTIYYHHGERPGGEGCFKVCIEMFFKDLIALSYE